MSTMRGHLNHTYLEILMVTRRGRSGEQRSATFLLSGPAATDCEWSLAIHLSFKWLPQGEDAPPTRLIQPIMWALTAGKIYVEFYVCV